MFVRNAARTLALALGLVALLATAASASPPTRAGAAAAREEDRQRQPGLHRRARPPPRVGPSLAGKIVAHREQNGPFKRTEDLMEVKGIGEKMFAVLKPYVSVSGPTTLTEKVTSKGTRSAKARAEGEGARRPAAEKTGR